MNQGIVDYQNVPISASLCLPGTEQMERGGNGTFQSAFHRTILEGIRTSLRVRSS